MDPGPVASTKNLSIPFNQPSLAGDEWDLVQAALRDGHISGDGTFGRDCQRWLEDRLGTPRALLTTSCTHALEMCALLLDLQPGDEVIVPSFTFVSTANAFALRGARIVFADVRPDTMNLDETRWEALITDRTRAVVVVHYGGVACEMDTLLETAHRRGVTVVEDNAHGLFGGYRGRALGTLGRLGTLSFHETKNISCGEGGALLVNDPSLIQRAEIIRDKGTNRQRFFRGEVDKYTWVGLGSSYVMSDLLAAFLRAQLAGADRIQQARERLWRAYADGLEDWARENGVTTVTPPAHCDPAWHLFAMVMPTPEARTSLIAHLREQGILAVFHYQALHASDVGRSMGASPGDCPVASRLSDCLVRLPFFNSMTADMQGRVIEAVRAWPGAPR